MKTLSIALVLAVGAAGATGCTGSEVDDQDDDDDNDDDDDVTPDEPTSAVGKYDVASEFDMVSGLPGNVGSIVNGFIDATDDGDDPGRYICDTAAAAIENDTLRDLAEAACAVGAGYINDRLLEIAPDFVDALISLGNDFGQIAKNFGTTSELDITMANGALIATHTLDGVTFTVDSVSTTFKLADYDIEPIVVQQVGITYDETGKLTIAHHEIPVQMGAVLRLAIDELLVPAIDPLATDLGDMFLGLVDCYQVGVAIYDAVGFGSVSTYESACEAGLEAAGGLVYSQLENLDANAMKFGIAGEARATDNNSDDLIDKIDRGEWAGNVDYAGTLAPLSASTFAAERK